MLSAFGPCRPTSSSNNGDAISVVITAMITSVAKSAGVIMAVITTLMASPLFELLVGRHRPKAESILG